MALVGFARRLVAVAVAQHLGGQLDLADVAQQGRLAQEPQHPRLEAEAEPMSTVPTRREACR